MLTSLLEQCCGAVDTNAARAFQTPPGQLPRLLLT